MMLAHDLIGVWVIQSFYLENPQTGERSQPWGERPSGTVIFHPNGRMFALITSDDRSPPKTEADQAAAFRKMLAYSGEYRIDLPNRLVTTVDISWFESWIGTEQIRICDLNGDCLKLTSAPLFMPQEETPVFAVVLWRRERALLISK
jgi:Lipocalin-like domain